MITFELKKWECPQRQRILTKVFRSIRLYPIFHVLSWIMELRIGVRYVIGTHRCA